MIRRLAPLLIALILSGCSGTDVLSTFRTDLTQRSLDELPIVPAFDVDDLAAEHDGEPAYFFDIERTVEHVFLLPESFVWVYVEDLRQQYVVLDPEEDRYTTFRVSLASRENLDGVFLRTTSPDGVVQTYSTSDLIRDNDDDKTIYRFAYPGVERGTVIEEVIRTNREMEERQYQPPLYIDAPLQREVPVGSFAFRYVYPANWAMSIKAIGPRRIPPYELDRSSYIGRTVVSFLGEDLPGFPDEPYSPYFKEIAPYLEMQVTSIPNPYDPNEDPIVSTSTSWGELMGIYSKYVSDKGGRRYREVEELAETLTQGLETDSARVAAIVGWVQSNTESGGEADDIASVLRERKGNSLLRTSLAQAMLNEVGVESEYIMIHPVSNGYFDRSFVSFTQFTEPALLLDLAGAQTVVLPYVEGLPISAIPEFYQGASAIVVRPEGSGKIVTLPTRDAETYAVDEDYTVDIDEDGVIRVEETKTLRGIAAFAYRSDFQDMTQADRDEEIRELLTYSEGEIEGLNYDIVGLDAFGEPLAITIRYTIPDLVTVTPEEVIFQTGGLLSPASLSAFEVDVRERQLPIRIYNDRITNKSITIRYPETWTLASVLEDTADRNRFGSVRGIYTMAPGEIRAEQQILLKQSRASPRAYSGLLSLTGSESKLYVPTLVFTLADG